MSTNGSRRVAWKPVKSGSEDDCSPRPATSSKRRGVPAWLFLVAPALIVAVVFAVVYVLSGGSRHEGGAQSSGQSITATGGNNVAVNDGGLLGFYELVRERHPQAGDTPSGNNSVDHESQGVWERDARMDGRSVRAWLDADGRRVGVDGWPRCLEFRGCSCRGVQ